MAEERVPLEIRRAEPEDAAELLSIYAPYVKESWVTFECVPPTVEEFLTAPDEGGYAAVALRFIRAITDGENCRMVLSVPNNGAIDGLRDDDVVEITCDIRSDGAHPVRIGAIDEFQLQQIKRLKYFERCTIQAILEDDRDAAVKGLALHPLVNDFELAETLTDIFFDAEFIHMNETP